MSDRPDPTSRFEVTDVEALRALTHPLRARILGVLRREGAATASQLGRRLGESSGATSYHLRQLHRFGFVEEAPEQSSRRERLWRATHALTSIDPRRFSGGADAVVLDEFSRRQLAQLEEQSRRWTSRRAGASPEWVSAAGFSDAMARLSPAACAELHERLTDLVDELQARSAGEPDVAWVSVFLAALPMSDEEVLG
jgi:DNA-binding transcriptional ArsR family regulator